MKFKKYYKSRQARAIVGAKDKYYTGKNLPSPNKQLRLKELHNHRKRVLSWLGFLLGMIIVLLIIISQLINNPKLEIEYDNEIVKLSSKNSKAYLSTINQYFADYPFERLAFLLNKQRFTNYVTSYHHELKSAKLAKVSAFGQDKIKLSVREPIVMLEINGQFLFVDANGVSFKKHYFAKPRLKIIDRTGIQIDQQTTVISRRLLEFIGQAVSLFEQQKYQIDKIIIPPNMVHQVDLYIKGKNYPIKLTIDNDISSQVNGLLKVIKRIERTGTKVKYLDGRVIGKVYYK